MKKLLLWLVTLTLVVTFSLVGCKAAAVAEKEEEAVVVEEEAPAVVEEEEAVEKPYAGKTVTVYSRYVSGSDWNKFVKAVEDKTGIIVKGTPAPEDITAKLTALLAAGDSTFDIIHIDELLTAGFTRAGYLEPIDDVMTPEVAKLYPSGIIENISTLDGKIYTVPTDLSPMFLFVNIKAFADAGIEYPKTEDEFMAAAKALTKNGMYGYGGSWAKGGFLYNDAIRWMNSYDGDFYDWTKSGSKEALEKMYDFIYTDKITPQAVLGDSYDIMNQKFISGQYAMVWQWPYLAGVMADKFEKDFTIIPQPTFKTNKTIVSGWHLVLNKASNNKDAAKEVLKFWASDEGQLLNVECFEDESCANANVLNNPDVMKAFPILQYLGQYSDAGALTPRPISAKATQIMDSTESIISKYLTKQIIIDQCMEEGQKELNTLLGK